MLGGQPGEHVNRLALRKALGARAPERVLPQRAELGLMESAEKVDGQTRQRTANTDKVAPGTGGYTRNNSLWLA